MVMEIQKSKHTKNIYVVKYHYTELCINLQNADFDFLQIQE